MNPLDYERMKPTAGADTQQFERCVFASAVFLCPLVHWPVAGILLIKFLDRFSPVAIVLALLGPRFVMIVLICIASCRRRILKWPWSDHLEAAILFTGVSLFFDILLLFVIFAGK